MSYGERAHGAPGDSQDDIPQPPKEHTMKIGIPEQQDHPLAPNRPLEPITWRQARAEPHGYYERKAYADGWNDAVKVATASAKVSLTTGRFSQKHPQIQNLPGTLAAAMEMYEAKHGPDPSVRLSTCPAKDETLLMKVSLLAKGEFTHRDKGGCYRLDHICKPAGEVMRRVGMVVTYYDVHSRQVYCRDIEDFVRIMEPLQR